MTQRNDAGHDAGKQPHELAALYTQCAQLLDAMRVLNRKHGHRCTDTLATKALNRALTYATLYAVNLAREWPQSDEIAPGHKKPLPTPEKPA